MARSSTRSCRERPAAEAGLKTGDVITKLNGQAIDDAGDLTRQVGMLKPGDKVELTYLRDGAEKTAEVDARRAEDREDVAKADDSRDERQGGADARHPARAGQARSPAPATRASPSSASIRTARPRSRAWPPARSSSMSAASRCRRPRR